MPQPTHHNEEHLPSNTVLIAGGGPVGLLLATVLSHFGVRSVLLERNPHTTKWPKMDLTNARSMEIFRRLGLADGLREKGVAPHISHNVLISTGLGVKEAVAKWLLPSVEEFRTRIREKNDGTQPREAWQRISQVHFEVWLKGLCEVNPMIDARFAWKVEGVECCGEKTVTTATNTQTGLTTRFVSKYLAGCDGASSVVRKALELPLDGGPAPGCVLLVHFKSRDLTRLHAQGQFWHMFFLLEPGQFGGVIIAQDEIDTWTIHLFLPPDADTAAIESEDAIYTVLGGLNGKYKVEIDEILVRSVWRPTIAVAQKWSSPNHCVFLAGDAAHQNIPTGGYGMNMGISDAYNLGWKLAAAIKYGGPGLLESYEAERRPVALRSVEHSGRHMLVHASVGELLKGGDPHRIDSATDEGAEVRRRVREHYKTHNTENTDLGIEMGYIYESSVIHRPDTDEGKPEWLASHYVPSTWPGSRVPHVFLEDGSAVFDRLGKEWSLVTFTNDRSDADTLLAAAHVLQIAVKHVDLKGESHVRSVWGQDLVIVRPDEHVAWSSNSIESAEEARGIWEVAIGTKRARHCMKDVACTA